MKTIEIAADRLDDFLDLSWSLYGRDPARVPPIRDSLVQELLREDETSGHYQRRKLFLCESGNQVVGRVAAMVDVRLTDGQAKPMGQIGYFEAIDNPRVSTSLLDAAFDWLRGQDVSEVIGPINGGAHRTHRFMTGGFERDPFLLEPRNPSYYPRLFEAYGFTQVCRWSSFDLNLAAIESFSQREAIRHFIDQARQLYRIDYPDVRAIQPSLQRMYGMMHDVWHGHPGYVPIEMDEFLQVGTPLLSLMEQGDVLVVVNSHGRDVGFGFMYPDYVNEVRSLQGDGAGWASWIDAARAKRYVLHTFGLRDEAKRTGASLLLVKDAIEQLSRRGIDEVVVALVVEGVRLFHRIAQPTRTHVLYGRSIQT